MPRPRGLCARFRPVQTGWATRHWLRRPRLTTVAVPLPATSEPTLMSSGAPCAQPSDGSARRAPWWRPPLGASSPLLRSLRQDRDQSTRGGALSRRMAERVSACGHSPRRRERDNYATQKYRGRTSTLPSVLAGAPAWGRSRCFFGDQSSPIAEREVEDIPPWTRRAGDARPQPLGPRHVLLLAVHHETTRRTCCCPTGGAGELQEVGIHEQVSRAIVLARAQ